MLMNIMNFQERNCSMQNFPYFIPFLDLHKVGPVSLYHQTMFISSLELLCFVMGDLSLGLWIHGSFSLDYMTSRSL